MNIYNSFSALNFICICACVVYAGTSRAETHLISGAYICNCMHCKKYFIWLLITPAKIICHLLGHAMYVHVGKVTSLTLTDHSRITKKKGEAGSVNMVQRISSYAASEILLKFLQFTDLSSTCCVLSSKNSGYTSFVSCLCLKDAVLSF